MNRESTPSMNEVVQAGDQVPFSFTVHYQVNDDWSPDELNLWFLVLSYTETVSVRFEYVDLMPIEDRDGTMRFQGVFTVPDCGSIVWLELIGRIYTRDTDFSSYVQDDSYFIQVANASSTPCPE